MVEKMKTFPTLCWESSESPCFPRSYVISAELRSECISSAQKPEFNCLLTRVYSGQRAAVGMCGVCTQGGLHQHTTPNAAHISNSEIVLSSNSTTVLRYRLWQILVSLYWCCWPSVSHVCPVRQVYHVAQLLGWLQFLLNCFDHFVVFPVFCRCISMRPTLNIRQKERK